MCLLQFCQFKKFLINLKLYYGHTVDSFLLIRSVNHKSHNYIQSIPHVHSQYIRSQYPHTFHVETKRSYK